MMRTILAVLLLCLTLFTSARAQKRCSDNGDGTYTNPVIAADFPDPDVILVDSTYYMSFEDFKNYLRQDAATFPDSRMTIDHVVAEGNFVAFHGTYVATQKGPMGPFPSSNKQMSVEIAGVQRFENGKIAAMRVTWDNLAAVAQLGYFPPSTQQTQ